MGRSETRHLRQLVRGTLMADPVMADLVAGRVYGAALEDSAAETTLASGPIAVFELLSGAARWHGHVATQSLELYGYSRESLDQAAEVYDAAFDALQHERLEIDGIPMCGLIREVQRPLDGFNDKIRAWYVRGRWVASTAS